jgi:hypothetical protein
LRLSFSTRGLRVETKKKKNKFRTPQPTACALYRSSRALWDMEAPVFMALVSGRHLARGREKVRESKREIRPKRKAACALYRPGHFQQPTTFEHPQLSFATGPSSARLNLDSSSRAVRHRRLRPLQVPLLQRLGLGPRNLSFFFFCLIPLKPGDE